MAIASQFKSSVYYINSFMKGSYKKTFDSFIVNSGNSLAYHALLNITKDKNLDIVFNPIYIFGRSGSGKTHLMEAVVSKLRDEGQSVVYCNCEDLTAAIIKTIREGCLNELQCEIRKASVLVIDEVSYLIGKSRIQEEFFNAFNSMYMAGKQIILSSRMSPYDMSGVESRLISRFQWGLLIPIEKQSIGKDKDYDIYDVIENVCRYYSINEDVLEQKNKDVAQFKKVVIYICRDILKIRLNIIAAFFKKDSTTISVNSKAIREKIQTDRNLNREINEIILAMKSK